MILILKTWIIIFALYLNPVYCRVGLLIWHEKTIPLIAAVDFTPFMLQFSYFLPPGRCGEEGEARPRIVETGEEGIVEGKGRVTVNEMEEREGEKVCGEGERRRRTGRGKKRGWKEREG